MPEDYTTAMLMSDVMSTVQDNLPPIIKVALFLASVNFLFGLLYWTISFLMRAPFSNRH